MTITKEIERGIISESIDDFINIAIKDSVIFTIIIGAKPPTPYFLLFINKYCAILAPAINSKITTKMLIKSFSTYFNENA